MTHPRHDIAPRQSPVDYLCLLEREREEARAMLDELQARAFAAHLQVLEAEFAPEPPRLPTWVVVLALAPLVALALGLAHAGRPLAALAAVLAAVAIALALR